MPAFADASRITRLDDTRFAIDVPSGWEQGRGAFGGLTLGVLLRAIEACEPDAARIVRTLSGELAGPVAPGPAEIRVTPMRRGKNQSNLRADLWQGDVILGTASAVLSAPRTPAPEVPARTIETMPFDRVAAIPRNSTFPTFAQHFEYRIEGPLPFSGSADASARGWIRLREPLPAIDGPAVIAHLDSYWSAIASRLDRPRPFATVSFLAELLVSPATLSPTTPFYLDCRVLAASDGFVVEERALFQDDELVAMNHQTFAMIA